MKEETRVFTEEGHHHIDAVRNMLNKTHSHPGYYWNAQRTFRITIEDITPEPEEPQWWYWDREQQWRLSFERTPRVELQDGKVVSAVVFGNTDDRERKVDKLRDTFCDYLAAKAEANDL